MMVDTIELFRPIGPKELELIAQSGYREFPPRLKGQPIFYPVLTQEYAEQIARQWNAPGVGIGYVTPFQVKRSYLSKFDVKQVGSSIHKEYWIPAAELPQFNANIVGNIEIVAEFRKQG
jgi:hypothetical protein